MPRIPNRRRSAATVRRAAATSLPRRHLLGGVVLLGAGATGLTSLAACGDDDSGSGNLRFAWWGNPERDELTEAALAQFTEKTSREVDTQPANWDDHWTSLSTEIAGGNPPDLMQQDFQFLAEYTQNGSLLPLEDYVPDPIDTSVIPEHQLDSGRIDGTLYAISMGFNTFALASNQGVLADAGEEQPDDTLTWSEFWDLAVRISENTEDGVYGSQNAMDSKEGFECWLHQQGKALFTADGQLGYEASDLEEWMNFWIEMVAAGGCQSFEEVAEGTGALEDRGVPTRTGAFDFHWSNVVPAFVRLAADPVGVTMYPQSDTGGQNGQYFKASMYLSILTDASDPDGAAELLSALVLDTDVAVALGLERGVPAAETVREAAAGSLSDAEVVSLEYVERLDGVVGELPPPPPPAGPEIDQEFQFYAEEAGFERLSVADAAEQMVESANDLLN